MNPSTRRAYWRQILKQALVACFSTGLPLVFGILIAIAIVAYQQIHHVTVAHDGWFAVMKPYLVELGLWIVWQIAEACWKTYASIKKRLAFERLKRQFDEADLWWRFRTEHSQLWNEGNALWHRNTIQALSDYLGDVEVAERRLCAFQAMDNSEPNVEAEYLKRKIDNLKAIIEADDHPATA